MSAALVSLILRLRDRTRQHTLKADDIVGATAELAALGYQYNAEQFPKIAENQDWDQPSASEPRSLAEALLWKLGKWQVYQEFARHVADPTSQSKGTDVVFFAFAKHLQDRRNPIYDQHTLRGLWAIDADLTPEQSGICRAVLVNKYGTWKTIAGGRHAIQGYDLYVNRIRHWCGACDAPTPEAIDRFLMPLGQAIKVSAVFDAFSGLCEAEA